MENLKEYIRSKRPNLAETSINTYFSIIKTLYNRLFSDKKYDVNHFKTHHREIIQFLNEFYQPSRRKTVLSALYVLTELPLYKEHMMNDTRKYQEEINKQEKTDKQEEFWVNKSDIDSIYQHLSEYANILYRKKNLSMKEKQTIQNFVILSLFNFRFIAPRRLKDYTDFKISNIDKKKDNFLDQDELVFNSYKTSKSYGAQRIQIPKELSDILEKWISINPTEYLFYDRNKQPLTSVTLNQRLNKIFGGRVSVNNLRHTYLTDKYADFSKKEKQLEDDMKRMGSSSNMANTYIKLN